MKKLAFLTIGLFLLTIGNVSAFPLWPGYTEMAGTQFEDDNLDFFTDNDGDGLISTGDVLTSIIEFTSAIHLSETGLGLETVALDKANDDLVAIAQLEVLSVDASSGDLIMGEHNNEAIARFYTGGPINLDVLTGNPTLAQAEAAVTDGTHLWDFSITADPDTYWTFTSILAGSISLDPDAVRTLSSVNKVGVANYALNQVFGEDIFNPLFNALNVVDDGLVDLAGSGDILGGAGLTNAFARSDIDVLVNVVPEPATMTLFGISLLGLAFVSRRRHT